MLQSSISENEDYGEDRDIPCWMFEEPEASSSPMWSVTNELTFTNETVVRRVYLLARIMQDSLTKSGICYWTSGGTLLGCVRRQGLIPWDDDLDLCIYQKDEGKIAHCFKRLLNDNGCVLVEQPTFGYRVYHKTDSDNLPGEFINHRYPFCDLFVMKRRARVCVISSACGRTLWPEEYYHNKDIDHMVERLFGDILLNWSGKC